MIVTFKTGIPHEDVPRGADGGHCCGCFNISIDEDAPHRPYAVCNECGHTTNFTASGISPDDQRVAWKAPTWPRNPSSST
jgi:hypothetical protein